MKQGSTITIGSAGSNNVVFSGPGMYYRGDWATEQTYFPQDCVTVRTGTRTGLYLCTVKIVDSSVEPASAGGEGASWVKIASLATQPLTE